MNTIYLRIISFLILFMMIFALPAQENILDLAAQQEFLHPETALILAGIGSGSFNPLNVPDNPVEKLQEFGYIIPLQIQQQLAGNSDAMPWTSYGAFSFLITQLYDIPGGILYSIMPTAHYAIKELQYLDLIPPETHARQPISGIMASQIIQEITAIYEDGDIR